MLTKYAIIQLSRQYNSKGRVLRMKLPSIITGGVVPHYVYEKSAQEEKEHKQRKHDWRIALFSVLGGGVMGLITSFIFWLCTK